MYQRHIRTRVRTVVGCRGGAGRLLVGGQQRYPLLGAVMQEPFARRPADRVFAIT